MSWLQNELASLRRRHLLRKLRWADRVGPRIRLRGPDERYGQNVLLFCSNNYLGLADHPLVAACVRVVAGRCRATRPDHRRAAALSPAQASPRGL